MVDANLRRSAQARLTTDELRQRVEEVLAAEGGDALERYRRWSALGSIEAPLLILIGGAPGTGKSTVATQVAHRLGIVRIVSTDAVRQVMRAVVARELVPHVHTSSFEAAGTVPAEALTGAAAGADPTVVGFVQQAETVRVGVRGILDRAVEERFPLVLEGVHLVPGTDALPPGARATVVEVLLAVGDPAEHQSHFHARAAHTGDARPVERYLQAFDEIRRIQDHLLGAAARANVPVVEACHLDTAVRQILDMILERVAAAATLPAWPRPNAHRVAASAPTSLR
jgi:2-phosphoglycerate kinase